ncbi:uncharacterized protein LOC132705177 [Cylas formicarius]|uniref:uncharacterized protein LOC132705177 n=1 Tax=Cylas formicarius TaxID=197179 RepID=UPI0029589F8F|nr:uncharacterized protein LOC132705177 [Cylas formicarius]
MAFLATLFLLSRCVKSQEIGSILDTDSLSELPLDKLLNVKKNLNELTHQNLPQNRSDHFDDISITDEPGALALTSKFKLTKLGTYLGPYDEDYKHEGGKKSVTTVFQLSVTTLAFLAFGGYLVYLVVAAISGKNYNYVYNPNTQLMAAMINSHFNHKRRHKKKKRKRRPIKHGHFGYKEADEVSREKRAAGTDEDGEVLYRALVNLSEGCAKFYEQNYVDAVASKLLNVTAFDVVIKHPELQ